MLACTFTDVPLATDKLALGYASKAGVLPPKLKLPDPSVCKTLPALGAVLGNVKV